MKKHIKSICMYMVVLFQIYHAMCKKIHMVIALLKAMCRLKKHNKSPMNIRATLNDVGNFKMDCIAIALFKEDTCWIVYTTGQDNRVRTFVVLFASVFNSKY